MKRNLFYLPVVLLVVCTGTLLLSQTRARNGDSRKYRLSPIVKVSTSKNPTMDAGRLNVNLLMDGKLPEDGWRSTWTEGLKWIQLLVLI